MKARPVIHSGSHRPGGSDPIPGVANATLFAPDPLTVAAGSADRFTNYLQGVGFDGYVHSDDFVTITAPGLYLAWAEALGYPNRDSFVFPQLMLWDGASETAGRDGIGKMAGDYERTGEAVNAHRFYAVSLFALDGIPDGTTGRLYVYMRNNDVSSRSFNDAALHVLRLTASSDGIDGTGWWS